MDEANGKTATEKISGKSVQTNTAQSSQQQPTTTPDGSTRKPASGVVAAEGTARTPHLIATAETQSASTIAGATFVAPAINPDTISVLSDDDLIAACKSQFKLTDSSYSLFREDTKAFDSVIASAREQGYSRFVLLTEYGDVTSGTTTE